LETLLLQLSEFESWRIGLIATWLLLQGVVVALFPEEVIAVTLGVLWSQQKISFPECLIFMQAGLLPANAFMVEMGRRFGLPITKRRPFSWLLDANDIEEWLQLIRTNKKKVIFFARFTPMIRGPIYFATGMSQLRLPEFSRIDFLASLIQIPLLLVIGKWIGVSAGSLMGAFQNIGVVFLILFGWMVLFGFIRKLKRRRTNPNT
jgi:membrane protein DedA with SNARE-associated domain